MTAVRVPPAARNSAAVALAVALALSAVVLPAPLAGAGTGLRQSVVLRDETGLQLDRAELPPGSRFALAYRNSLYGAPAEERFAAFPDGTFRLVQVASDRLAVLEEYYALGPTLDRAVSGRLRWEHTLTTPPAFRELRVLADRLGRRTLLVGTRRIELWRLVGDGAVVRLILQAERG